MGKKKYLLVLASSLILVCYQNFSPLSSEELKTLDRMREMQNIEKHSRGPASLGIAVPQSGRTLESVSSDWLERQGNILLGGRDKEFLDTINHRLTAWFGGESDEQSAADSGRKPASTEAPSSFRFTRVNEMEYILNQGAMVSCTLDLDGAHLDYSHKLSANTHLGVDHWTGKNQTQLLLKYNW